jgi:hypothetical protein
MKVIGRKTLVDADVGPYAKRRISLLVRQLQEANPATFTEMKAIFPSVADLGGNRLAFRFEDSGLEVQASGCLHLHIICIDAVSE